MSDKRKRAAGKMSVSAHPAFPAIVALWFAGLLGIGTLVLPAVLIERISEATSLSAYFVAAHPPLGITARIALALGAGLAGILAGLAIARTIARAHAEGPAARRPATDVSGKEERGTAIVKRPISAHDELFEGGLDADSEFAADSPGFVSAPGPEYQLDEGDTAPAAHIANESATASVELSADDGVLELGPVEELGGEDPADAWDFEPSREVPGPIEVTAFKPQDTDLSGASAIAAVDPEETPPPSTAARPEPELAVGIDVGGNVAIADLVDRFARALQRHRVGSPGQSEQSAPTAAEADDEAAEDGASSDRSRVTPGADIAMQVAAADTAPADSLAPAETGASMVAASRIPDALREIDFEYDEVGDEDDDGVPALDLSFSLAQSARPFGRPEAPAAGVEAIAAMAIDDDGEETDEDGSEENYSSLLAMKGPSGVQREPVRFMDDESVCETGDDGEDMDEPVVAFPSPGASKPDAEQALRDALEKLQRMSGAA